MNTYLYSKPSFTSPQPLAAASSLTIPLSITLSEIKLSAFIILVFSKQKGLTLVFRNDPLESLKVSSTFDSIQFVRDYLQRTIEQQLRNLMMEELPAIIHRLSLELWCPDQAGKGVDTPWEDVDEQGIDPFASPPEDPVDAQGNLLDPNAVSELTLNGGGEVQSLFSQKNLLRLAALTDSHRTLSLFTPGIQDVVFRAWSSHGDRSASATSPLATPSLAKTYSVHGGGSTTYTFSDAGSSAHGYFPSRPSLVSHHSASVGLPHGSGHRSRPGRKKKTRVVNLRRSRSEAGSEAPSEDNTSDAMSVDVPCSEPVLSHSIPEEADSGVAGTADPSAKARFTPAQKDTSSMRQALMSEMYKKNLEQAAASLRDQKAGTASPDPAYEPLPEKSATGFHNGAAPVREYASSSSDTSSVILEQAWIMKMAGEIARRVYDEKNRRQQGLWEDSSDSPPPPAYEAATP